MVLVLLLTITITKTTLLKGILLKNLGGRRISTIRKTLLISNLLLEVRIMKNILRNISTMKISKGEDMEINL